MPWPSGWSLKRKLARCEEELEATKMALEWAKEMIKELVDAGQQAPPPAQVAPP